MNLRQIEAVCGIARNGFIETTDVGSKGYVSNHIQGPPVSKPVRLPKNWRRLHAHT